MAFCIYCGKAIEDTDLFCGHCGKPTNPDSAKNGPEDDPASPPLELFQSANPESARSRSIKTFVIVSCIAIVVLLVVAGVLLWQFFQNGTEQPASPDGSSNTSLSQKSGDQAVSIPDLSGSTEATARETVEGAGLAIGVVSEEYSASVAKGSVVSQTPAAGTSADAGSKVNLVVSKGAQPTIVHTYEVIAEPLTWTEAKAYCESKGGYLACISSKDEHDAVLSATRGLNQKVFWLGGYRDPSHNTFRWVDGSPMTYTAWATGEPNNDEGIEDYLALFDSNGTWGWYDAPNDLSPTYKAERRGFVMEREVGQ